MKHFSSKRLSVLLITGAQVFMLCGAHAQERTASRQGAERGQQQRRLAPPAAVKCPLDNLTVYEGRILSYSRNASRTYIKIRTDYETTEAVTIRHARSGSPLNWFLLRAEPFKASDWRLVEVRRGRLRPNMRANIWVCTDGSNPVVDWQPPETN